MTSEDKKLCIRTGGWWVQGRICLFERCRSCLIYAPYWPDFRDYWHLASKLFLFILVSFPNSRFSSDLATIDVKRWRVMTTNVYKMLSNLLMVLELTPSGTWPVWIIVLVLISSIARCSSLLQIAIDQQSRFPKCSPWSSRTSVVITNSLDQWLLNMCSIENMTFQF